MEDPNLNISIDADSSGAVSAFDALGSSVDEFGGKLDDTKKKIKDPYEHAGVALFSRQLFGLSGMSGIAGQALSVIRLGFNRLAIAAGTTTAALGPYLLAAGALLVVYKAWSGRNKEVQETLGEVIVEQQRHYDSTVDLSGKLGEYNKVMKGLSPTLDALAESTRKVNEQNRFALLVSEANEIQRIEKLIRLKKDFITSNNEAIASNIKEGESYGGHLESGELVEQVNRKLIASNALLVIQIEKENKARLEIKANIEAQAKGYKDLSGQMEAQTRAAEKSAKDQVEAQKKVSDALRSEVDYRNKLHRESLDFVNAIMNSRYNMEIAALHGIGAQNAVFAHNMEEAWGSAYLSIAKGAGDSFASMLIDGESFNGGMDKVFKNVLKTFISMLIEMEIRWAASAFLRLVGGGSFAPAAAIVWQGPPTPAASGFEGVISKPTMFMVGEGGEPEHVKVTPQSQARISSAAVAAGGGGDTYHVSIVNQISGGDSNQIAEKTMQKTIYAIRARGQLDFVRGT